MTPRDTGTGGVLEAMILKYRTGESIRKLLRSNSGGYFLAGTVTITQNGQVEHR